MIQPSRILCGGTHQSWSQKIAKDKDRTVYMLGIKLPSMMENCVVEEYYAETFHVG